jgi:hypothetical protein
MIRNPNPFRPKLTLSLSQLQKKKCAKSATIHPSANRNRNRNYKNDKDQKPPSAYNSKSLDAPKGDGNSVPKVFSLVWEIPFLAFYGTISSV